MERQMTRYLVLVSSERTFTIEADNYEEAEDEVRLLSEEELLDRSGGYIRVVDFSIIDTPGIDTPS
jgi:hypothetical protein